MIYARVISEGIASVCAMLWSFTLRFVWIRACVWIGEFSIFVVSVLFLRVVAFFFGMR